MEEKAKSTICGSVLNALDYAFAAVVVTTIAALSGFAAGYWDKEHPASMLGRLILDTIDQARKQADEADDGRPER